MNFNLKIILNDLGIDGQAMCQPKIYAQTHNRRKQFYNLIVINVLKN